MEFNYRVNVVDSIVTQELPDTKNEKGETIYNVKSEIRKVEILVSSTISVPTWKSDNATEQAKWDSESGNLRDHENDHQQIAAEGATNILKKALEATPRPSAIGSGKTLQEAQNDATQKAFDQGVQPIIVTATKEVQSKQDALDLDTENGKKKKPN